jgi:hypothetical protein
VTEIPLRFYIRCCLSLIGSTARPQPQQQGSVPEGDHMPVELASRVAAAVRRHRCRLPCAHSAAGLIDASGRRRQCGSLLVVLSPPVAAVVDERPRCPRCCRGRGWRPTDASSSERELMWPRRKRRWRAPSRWRHRRRPGGGGDHRRPRLWRGTTPLRATADRRRPRGTYRLRVAIGAMLRTLD